MSTEICNKKKSRPASDRLEIKRLEERSRMRADIEACFEDATAALKRSDIIKLMQGK